MPELDVRNVVFCYPRNAEPALADVTFRIGAGITGIVGPNGAGKSTLLRILAGFVSPQSGTVRIDGRPPRELRTACRIGLIPETPWFDDYLTVADFIGGLATITGTSAAPALAHLDEIADRQLGALSLGQKRRVELAAALLNDPDLVLLDEPTNGLDPFAIAEMRRQLESMNVQRRTVFVSSHHLDELQRTADQFVLLAKGRFIGCWERAAAINEHGSVEGLFHGVLGNLASAE